MRFSNVLAASVVIPLIAAHGVGMPGAPKIFGMSKHVEARNPSISHWEVATPVQGPTLRNRQGGNIKGRCGTQGGDASCDPGLCCSPEGYCGITEYYCAAPDCQFNFGPGCDANKTPAGASTRNDARVQLGGIAYGGLGIRECLKPNTVAITYDDGPYIYTEQVMAQFEARNAHATFFITGNNRGKGAIDETWRSVITNMYNKGHQIASHTWSHQDLSNITQEQRYDQMIKNEMAIRNIIGRYPTYMRPPYSSCNNACQAVLADLGYVVTSFDLDTDDYNQLTKEKIQTAKDNFKNGLNTAGPRGERLAIAHDIHELTALNLTGYMLDYVYSQGFTAVTVGECMNDPPANWYRESTPAAPSSISGWSSSPVPTPTSATSINGACGTLNAEGGGQSCIGFVGPDGLGECCSQYGWCGNSADYCGSGCNPIYGKCGLQSNTSSSVSVSQTTSTLASSSRTSSSPQPTVSLETSLTGECGATVSRTCIGFVHDGAKAECCSPYKYCGNTAAHCGMGCNPLFGICEGDPSLNSSSSASSSMVTSMSSSLSGLPSSSATTSSSTRSASPVTTSLSLASSTITTSVRPSATISRPSPATTATTPAKTPVSSNGRCGGDYGGQTCAGYTNLWGWKIECCSRLFGRCSTDPWTCGFGCDKAYGKCWF